MGSARPGRAVVLGAGIQGVCSTLALRERGWEVTVVDRAPAPLLGASAHGEGKLHLGFVYANDASERTADLMLEGATMFATLLDRWLPAPIDWVAARSEPFWYGVVEDTLVPVDVLCEHYERVAAAATAFIADGRTYAGLRPATWIEPMPTPASTGRPLLGSFRTAEVAVDPRVLRSSLLVGLEAREVVFLGGTWVEGVERTPAGFAVTLRNGPIDRLDADVVVNCLWDGRLAVDATLGLTPSRPWVLRLKRYVEGRLPATSPSPGSATFVLGPYGDTVARADGRLYVSWYPESLVGWTSDISPPEAWLPMMDGTDTPEARAADAARIIEGFGDLLPALRHLEVERVGAGVIFAWGDRDIDDRTSELHHRSDVGVSLHDGYATIDTGKLTTAPLFASQLADRW